MSGRVEGESRSGQIVPSLRSAEIGGMRTVADPATAGRSGLDTWAVGAAATAFGNSAAWRVSPDVAGGFTSHSHGSTHACFSVTLPATIWILIIMPRYSIGCLFVILYIHILYTSRELIIDDNPWEILLCSLSRPQCPQHQIAPGF